MIGKAVKYAKVLALVVMVVGLIYLISVSSIFSSDSSNPIDNPVSSGYEFNVQIYQDDSFLLEMTSGTALKNATVLIEHNPLLDPSHTIEQENREISLNGSNDVTVIDTVSSESITKIEVSDSEGTLVYEDSFGPENSVVEFQGERSIYLSQVDNQTIEIDESLSKDASTIDGSNYISGESNVEYEWSMGDGTVYDEENIDHRYDEIGDYEVTLTAKAGKYQQTETFNVTVTVRDAIESISAPDRAKVGEEVLFNGNKSTTNQTARAEWFIDGERYTQLNPTVSFDERGAYKITLTALNRAGDSEIETDTILVVG